MNRKGFTLIELVAVVFIFGLILVIAVPSISNTYKNSRLKSEEIFIDRLSNVIDSYVKLNSDTIEFDLPTISATKENQVGTVTVNRGIITVNEIINNDIMSLEDYINAGNKGKQCKKEAKIEVYRDSDFVYCYKMSKYELDCLTEEYKNSLKIPATETEEEKDIIYVIDTCIWEEVN